MFSSRNMSRCNGEGIDDDLRDADHSSDGTILKAMDMETAARSHFPGDAQSVSPTLHIQALSSLHTQKVRTLMKSIDELKRKLAIATAQSKDHRRSAMIQSMRTRLKEQELVVDVVKEEMGRRAGMNAEEVNEWVIRKTIGGPLRFRPKTREELQNELFGLERRHHQALERLKPKRASSHTGPALGPESHNGRAWPQSAKREDFSAELLGGAYYRSEGSGGPQTSTTAHMTQLSEALEEVDALRVSVRSRDAALKNQGEVIDQLRAEARELKGVQEKLGRKERKAKELKEKNGALAEEHAALMQAYEASREQVRHLNAQMELRAERAAAEATARAEAFHRESRKQAEEMNALLEREKDLASTLQAERTSMHRECMELHQCARQALNRAEVADKSAREAMEQTERLQEQLQRLAREAAAASGLRERSSELVKEVERLSALAETGQGGLDEARERAARAEEGMRVCQELLKQEREVKERLIAEFSEARTRQEVERNRAKEIAEGRVGLNDPLSEHEERGKEQPEKSLEDSPCHAGSGEQEAESMSNPNDKTADEQGQAADEQGQAADEQGQAADEQGQAAQPGSREQESQEADGLDQERHPEGAIYDAASQSEIGDTEGTRHPVSDLQPVPVADEDQQLRAELASSRAPESTARREVTQLKADLEDARATCERHKAKAMELLRNSEKTLSRGDDPGDVQGANVDSEPSLG